MRLNLIRKGAREQSVYDRFSVCSQFEQIGNPKSKRRCIEESDLKWPGENDQSNLDPRVSVRMKCIYIYIYIYIYAHV